MMSVIPPGDSALVVDLLSNLERWEGVLSASTKRVCAPKPRTARGRRSGGELQQGLPAASGVEKNAPALNQMGKT